MKVLIVQSDGTREVRTLDGQLAELQQIVGGYIEPIAGNGWVAYVNEDGKEQGQSPNVAATTLAAALGWRFLSGDYLAGPAVFLGHDGGPDETDVPERVIRLAEAIERRVQGYEDARGGKDFNASLARDDAYLAGYNAWMREHPHWVTQANGPDYRGEGDNSSAAAPDWTWDKPYQPPQM